MSKFTFTFIAILVVGGGYDSNSVEALHSDGTSMCKLPNLPGPGRWEHTMDGNMLCGGFEDAARNSCILYDSGSWQQFSWSLTENTFYHSSWKRPDGKIQLMEYSTTEVVSPEGTEAGFNLKYPNV